MRGYAVDANGNRISRGNIVRVAQTPADIPATERQLMVLVLQKLPQSRNGGQKRSSLTGAYAEAYKALEDTYDPISMLWNDRTRRRHMTYFANQVLPELIQNGDSWDENDTERLRTKLVAMSLSSKRASGLTQDAESTVSAAMRAAATIYARMRLIAPNLPEIDLAPGYRPKKVQSEQVKSLEPSVWRKVAAEIRAAAATEPNLAMAAALMLDCGLRTAEAAAVHATDLIRNPDGTMSVDVGWQAQNGKRVSRLKTDNAYRRVPMTNWGRTTVEECLQYISEPAADAPLCDDKKTSAWIRDILQRCGCTQTYLEAMRAEEKDRPELDAQGKPVQDIAAYILRRDWTSRARNVCGLTADEVDYLLGHASRQPKLVRSSYMQPEAQSRLSAAMERFVLDRTLSMHPGCHPAEVKHGDDIAIVPYGKFSLSNNGAEPLHLKMDLLAAVGAEAIILCTPSNAVKDERRRTIDTHGMRDDSTVIGSTEL
jgi:integrase